MGALGSRNDLILCGWSVRADGDRREKRVLTCPSAQLARSGGELAHEHEVVKQRH